MKLTALPTGDVFLRHVTGGAQNRIGGNCVSTDQSFFLENLARIGFTSRVALGAGDPPSDSEYDASDEESDDESSSDNDSNYDASGESGTDSYISSPSSDATTETASDCGSETETDSDPEKH